MLARKIFLESKSTRDKKFVKQVEEKDKKKCEKKRTHEHQVDKENIEGLENRMNNTVDMTKKIRKMSPKEGIPNKAIKECINGVPVYQDSSLGFDEELRAMIQPQRIDNDVDTDE